MRLQIDTNLKTIKVEGTVSLLELTETLERLLPNGVWKTFSLECGVTIVWTNPVQIYPYYPYYPWWITTTITNMGAEQVTYTLAPGTYNIEI